MLKDIFGSLGFVIVGSDILFWAYFFIMDNTCIPFVLINDRKIVPKYELGKVVAVSEPRYLPPQPGQYQAMQTRVVDLTVELTGETKTYTVPESQNVAKAMGITLSTSIDPIMNELNAIKNTSQDIINSVDAHRAKIEACESILEDINPAFKQTREQDRKIAGIENKVNDLTDSFEDLKKLIVERLK